MCISCKWEKKSLILSLKYSTVLWWGVLEANEDSFEVCPIKTDTDWSSNQIKAPHYVSKQAYGRLNLSFIFYLFIYFNPLAVFMAFRWYSIHVMNGQTL